MFQSLSVYVFRTPLRGQGSAGFQRPTLPSLPEGSGVPETKHLNILSKARQLVEGPNVGLYS